MLSETETGSGIKDSEGGRRGSRTRDLVAVQIGEAGGRWLQAGNGLFYLLGKFFYPFVVAVRDGGRRKDGGKRGTDITAEGVNSALSRVAGSVRSFEFEFWQGRLDVGKWRVLIRVWQKLGASRSR